MEGPHDDSPLKDLRVASPCHADWNEMDGDERVRFCRLCRLNVYNISEMNSADAEALIREKEGRLCVRFYRRRDGTVLTRNCPVGLRAIKRRLAVIGGGLAACLGWMFAGAASANSGSRGNAGTRSSAPAARSGSPLRSFVSYLERLWNNAVRPPVVTTGVMVAPPPSTPPGGTALSVGPPALVPTPSPNPAPQQTGPAAPDVSPSEPQALMGKVAIEPQPSRVEMGERVIQPAPAPQNGAEPRACLPASPANGPAPAPVAPPTAQEDF